MPAIVITTAKNQSSSTYSATTTRSTHWDGQNQQQQPGQQQLQYQQQQQQHDGGSSSGIQSPIPASSSQASGQYDPLHQQQFLQQQQPQLGSVSEQHYTSSFKVSGAQQQQQPQPQQFQPQLQQQFHLATQDNVAGASAGGLPTGLNFQTIPGKGFTSNQSNQWETKNPDGSVTKHTRNTSSTRKVFNSLQGLEQDGANGLQSPSPDFGAAAQQQLFLQQQQNQQHSQFGTNSSVQQGSATNQQHQQQQQASNAAQYTVRQSTRSSSSTSSSGTENNAVTGATTTMPQGPSLVINKSGQQPQIWQPQGGVGAQQQHTTSTSQQFSTTNQQQQNVGTGQSVQWPPNSNQKSPAGAAAGQKPVIGQHQQPQQSAATPGSPPLPRHPGATPMHNQQQQNKTGQQHTLGTAYTVTSSSQQSNTSSQQNNNQQAQFGQQGQQQPQQQQQPSLPRHPGATPMYGNTANKNQQYGQQNTTNTHSVQQNQQQHLQQQQQQPLAGDLAKSAIPTPYGQQPPGAGERGSIFGTNRQTSQTNATTAQTWSPTGGANQPTSAGVNYGQQQHQQQQYTTSTTSQYNTAQQHQQAGGARPQSPPVPSSKPTIGHGPGGQQPNQQHNLNITTSSTSTNQYGQQQQQPQPNGSVPTGLSPTQLAYLQQQKQASQQQQTADQQLHHGQHTTVNTSYTTTGQAATTTQQQQQQAKNQTSSATLNYSQQQQHDQQNQQQQFGRQQSQPGGQPQQQHAQQQNTTNTNYNASATIHQPIKPQQQPQQHQQNTQQSSSATLNYQQQQQQQNQQSQQDSTYGRQQQSQPGGGAGGPQQPQQQYNANATINQQQQQKTQQHGQQTTATSSATLNYAQQQQQQQHGNQQNNTNYNASATIQQKPQQQQQNQLNQQQTSTSATLNYQQQNGYAGGAQQPQQQQQNKLQQQSQQYGTSATIQQQQQRQQQQNQQHTSSNTTDYQHNQQYGSTDESDLSQKKGQQIWQDQTMSYAQGRQQQTGGTSAGNAPPAWIAQRNHQVNQKNDYAWGAASLNKTGGRIAPTAEQQATLAGSQYEDETPRPQLTQQLEQSYTVRYSDRAHFEIILAPDLVGEPSLQVEWFLNGQALRPSQNVIVQETFGKCSLDILATTEQYSGTYEVRVSTTTGQISSTSSLSVGEAPQPAQGGLTTSEWIDGHGQQGTGRYIKEDIKEEKSIDAPRFADLLPETLQLEEGEPLRLQTNLQPPNDPTMRIEWSVNGKPLMQGSRTATFCDFGLITLSVLDTRQDDSGEYTCRAYNQLGMAETTCRATCSARSKSNMKPMLQEPLVMSPPSNEINEGDTLHFEARIEPRTDPYLTVHWFHNGRPISEGSRFRPNYDFGFATLDIGTVISEDAGTITLVVRNTLGETSDTITIPPIEPRQRVVTTTQHPEAHAKIAALEYKDFSRTYEYNETSIHEPRFTTQLQQNMQVDEGQPLQLSVQLEPKGDPNMQVEWLFNGKSIRSGNRCKTTYDFGLATLSIDSVWAHDSGEYVVIASNPHGQQQSSCTIFIENKSGVDSSTQNQASVAKIQDLEAYMHDDGVVEGNFVAESRPAPQIVEQFTQITQEVREHQSLHIEGRLMPADDPTLKVEWFFNGQPLRASNRFRTSYDFGLVMLDITYVIAEDSGVYTMRAHNATGVITHEFSLDIKARRSIITDVQAPQGIAKIQELEDMLNYRAPEQPDVKNTQAPVFTKPLQGPQGKLKEGQCVHMEASLLPVGDPTLVVEWLHNGQPLVTGTRMRATHELDYVALDVDYVFPRDAGDYTCRAKNDIGKAETTYTVYCFPRRNVITESINPNSLQQIQKLESFM